MAKVYQAGRLTFFGIRSLEGNGVFVGDGSPFCLKLLSYLVVSGLEFAYSSIVNGTKRPKQPKGLVPFVALQDSGELMGDSQQIIEHFEGLKEPGSKLDGQLSASQAAVSHLIRRTIEESVYWTVGPESRWFDAKLCKRITGPKYLEGLGLGCFVGMAIGQGRKSFLKRAKGHGIGLHTKEERSRMGMQDLQALEGAVASLGDGPFVHGACVTTIDCVLYGMTANALFTAANYPCDADSPTAKLQAGAFPRLLAHYKHFESEYGHKIRAVVSAGGTSPS